MKGSSKKGSPRKAAAKKIATGNVSSGVEPSHVRPNGNGVEPKERVLPAALLRLPHQLLKIADLPVRVALFLFSALMLCTIRYWVIYDDLDSSWVFGLNYAAAHGLSMGRDIIYTYGP